MTTEEKFNILKNNLKKMDRVIIAFSGGVDSTFLLKAASLSGLSRVLAVTGVSASLPEEEFSSAKEITGALNIDHRAITTEELKNADYASNPPDRCYYCKKELFGKIKEIAHRENIPHILDGTNADDASDWRPGRGAAREEGVQSPLLEAGLSKQEIRELSKNAGLATWNKPATPCLSSRFPYGHKITAESLDRVHRAESFIKKYGIRELRVRIHADTARIEVLPREFNTLMEDNVREEIIAHLKSLGFKYITLDLQGFRSGSSNEVITDKSRSRPGE